MGCHAIPPAAAIYYFQRFHRRVPPPFHSTIKKNSIILPTHTRTLCDFCTRVPSHEPIDNLNAGHTDNALQEYIPIIYRKHFRQKKKSEHFLMLRARVLTSKPPSIHVHVLCFPSFSYDISRRLF